MDLVCGTGKKRSNTGSISSIFAEGTRQIGGAYDGRAINRRFPKSGRNKFTRKIINERYGQNCLTGTH
jgi:hypothetical protein